jgi:hypothetical protein
VLVRNGNRVTGTAAQLAHISDCGGWDAFLQRVAETAIQNFAHAYNAALRRPALSVVRNPKGGE